MKIFLVFFVTWVATESKIFQYIGLDFEIRKQGDITFYFTQFSVVNVYGQQV